MTARRPSPALASWRCTGVWLATLLLGLPVVAEGQLGSQRVGTSAVNFLNIGVGARSAGMGNASVAHLNDPAQMFHNPAGLAGVSKGAAFVEHVSWLTDIGVTALGVAHPLPTGGVGALSFMGLSVSMDETDELHATGTGRSFSHRDFAIGASYASYFTDRFAFGATGRMLYEALATEIGGPSATSWVIDLGTTYDTGFHGVVIGVAVQNFGPDVNPGGGFFVNRLGTLTATDYSGFSPPTNFRLGATYVPWQPNAATRLLVASEFVRPGANDETMRVGGELELMEGALRLRGGFDGASNALTWSGGAGVQFDYREMGAQLGYAFSQSDFFDRVDRLALEVTF